MELLGRTLAEAGVSEGRWLLDRPGVEQRPAESRHRGVAVAQGWSWRVELVPNPDVLLMDPAVGLEAVCTGAAVQLPPQLDDFAHVGVAVELPPQLSTVKGDSPIFADTKIGTVPPPPAIVVATADSAVLDRCPAWFNLARKTICRHVPSAMVVDMGAEA